MKLKSVSNVKSKSEAQSIAVAYQDWAGGQSLSWGEVAKYSAYFELLARKFHLVREFRENGII